MLTSKSKSSVEEIQGAITRANDAEVSAATEAERLKAVRPDMLLNGTDADLAQHDQAIAAAERQRDRAKAMLAALTVRLQSAVVEEEEKRCCAIYDEAHAAVTAYERTVSDNYRRAYFALAELIADADEPRRLRSEWLKSQPSDPNRQDMSGYGLLYHGIEELFTVFARLPAPDFFRDQYVNGGFERGLYEFMKPKPSAPYEPPKKWDPLENAPMIRDGNGRDVSEVGRQYSRFE
jgi:hypothetical protein